MSFEILTKITGDIKAEYPENRAWDESPFKWLRCLPPGSKGRAGRTIATQFLQSYGFTPMIDRGTTLRVNSLIVETRFGLMWESGDVKYQNIRDRKFDYVFCIALTPSSALAWLIPKTQLWENARVRTDLAGVTRQHKGADAWLTIKLDSPHLWLKPYGGTLEELVKVAQAAL